MILTRFSLPAPIQRSGLAGEPSGICVFCSGDVSNILLIGVVEEERVCAIPSSEEC